ncbi:NSFL1 cofactor p47, putative [Entamoeba invadens IP1]|uniref:NSFL1 cofactor p47, putative n=1 Tax=Entamoeba invadens IP1 TaxID=370355 RepID=UPI0002C3EB9B|nr:NSFL1 cofactor p47, putative [Entamoeba invadens IP1]ELP93764.1 NSFL1 cofactor p47, putative [Entamoeba invadens IP1]|eukprot:XP_004260535.1 NSFL1 cofactor p47, putative [Entamoeba invadens IP1]
MSNFHRFGDFEKKEQPKGQGYFNKGGTEFYSNDGDEAYKAAESTASRDNGNKYHDAGKGDFVLNVTMYQNGFVVNDGPLREYNTPENKKFIDDVKEGFIPQEYVEMARTSNIAINLTNSSKTQYVPKETKGKTKEEVHTYTGVGNVIGSTEKGQIFQAPSEAPTIDMTQPTVSIKVRFVDGKQKVFKVNKTTTVSQVYALVRVESNISGFRLVGPQNRIIVMSEINVVDAKIANASLTQQK